MTMACFTGPITAPSMRQSLALLQTAQQNSFTYLRNSLGWENRDTGSCRSAANDLTNYPSHANQNFFKIDIANACRSLTAPKEAVLLVVSILRLTLLSNVCTC